MKHPALCIVLGLGLTVGLTLGAGCSKPNDVLALQEDAHAIANYYKPQRDLLQSRLGNVMQQSGRVAKNLPGSDEAIRAFTDSRDKLVELDTFTKSVEKHIDELAKDGKAKELHDLIEDEEKRYSEGISFADDNLSQVESWLWNAVHSAAPVAPPAEGSAADGATPAHP